MIENQAFIRRIEKSLATRGNAAAIRAVQQYTCICIDNEGLAAGLDDLLRLVPVDRWPVVVCLAFLMSTATVPAELIPYRRQYRMAVAERYLRDGDAEQAGRVLNTLD